MHVIYTEKDTDDDNESTKSDDSQKTSATEEEVEIIDKFKQAGNGHYKKGEYSLAVVEYSKACDMNVLHVNMAPIFSNRS